MKRASHSARRLLERRRKRAAARSRKRQKSGRDRPPVASEDSGEPHVIITTDEERRLTMELNSATGVADKIDRNTFVAFSRCFVGADRLFALQHLYRLNSDAVPISSVAYWRNWKLIVLSTAGLAHELGEALQTLVGQPVFRRMEASVWEPLESIKKKWKTHPVLSKFRNQVSFHLGKAEVYQRGLEMAGTSRVVFSETDDFEDARAEVSFQIGRAHV